MTLITETVPAVRQADFAASPFAHPAMLWLISAVVVLRRLGDCRALSDQPGISAFFRYDGRPLRHDP